MKKNFIVLIVVFLLSTLSTWAQESPMTEKVLKRKVAIGRFTNETQYAKGIFYDKENDPMRKQALDILSAKLAASEKFILLERDGLESLVAEEGGGIDKIGADYIILGSITQFGRKNEGHQGVFGATKTQIVEAGVSVRLVDVASGLIIYSDEAKGYAEISTKQVMGIGGTAGFDATLSDKAINSALSQLVENIINKCMDKPWRGYLLSTDDGNYIISGGLNQGINTGSTFVLYKKGKSVKNPQTGVMIELPGTKLGTLTVTASMGDTPETEISFCTYDGADFDKTDLTQYYLMEK